jgi:hypothetical protein
MRKESLEGLKPFLPENSLEPIVNWLNGKKVLIRITRGRRTKLGDYRPPQKDPYHRISVNGDLNPYEFLMTLTHEIAHLAVWETYGRRAKPHGKAWKAQFSSMLNSLLNHGIFPLEMQPLVMKQVSKPMANSQGHTELVRVFRDDKERAKDIFLEDLPLGALFSLGSHKFQKQEKLRKWYRCIRLDNKRPYRISPVAIVIPLGN